MPIRCWEWRRCLRPMHHALSAAFEVKFKFKCNIEPTTANGWSTLQQQEEKKMWKICGHFSFIEIPTGTHDRTADRHTNVQCHLSRLMLRPMHSVFRAEHCVWFLFTNFAPKWNEPKTNNEINFYSCSWVMRSHLLWSILEDLNYFLVIWSVHLTERVEENYECSAHMEKGCWKYSVWIKRGNRDEATLRGFVELDLFCCRMIEVDGSVDCENNEVKLSRCGAIKMPQPHGKATWRKKQNAIHSGHRHAIVNRFL